MKKSMKISTVKTFLHTALGVALMGAPPALAGPDNVGLGNGKDGSREVNKPTDDLNVHALMMDSLKPGMSELVVDDTTGFEPGDLVIVLQTTGIETTQKPEETSVNLDDSLVGRWEFARLKMEGGVDDKKLGLTEPLTRMYPAKYTQVIRVPEFESLTIARGGCVLPKAWDGNKGGVLAFLVKNTLSTNNFVSTDKCPAAISATGMGFQGGQALLDGTSNGSCARDKDNEPRFLAAQKGEGIDAIQYRLTSTGGVRVTNAGGGGMCQMAGGGGGGNGGTGGNGGYSNDTQEMGGMGGAKLVYTKDKLHPLDDRLLMGGGGGAGHATANAPKAGGRGGGIVFIRANTLTGSASIQANGNDGGGNTSTDSGSGGGAGGTLYLRLAGKADCRSLEAMGGKGGESYMSGPGGGGGGGRILFQKGEENKEQGNCRAPSTAQGVHSGTLKLKPVTYTGPTNYGADNGLDGPATTLMGGFKMDVDAPVTVKPADHTPIRDTLPTYEGTSTLPDGSPVQVYVGRDGRFRLVGVTSVNQGRWGIKPTNPLDVLQSGTEYQVYAVAVHMAQGVASGHGNTHTFRVDTTAPSVRVETPSEGSQLDGGPLTFTGTVADNDSQPVMVSVDGRAPEAAVVNGNQWSYTPKEPLSNPGLHTVEVTTMDAAGNSASDSTGFKLNEPRPSTREFVGGGVGCAASGGTPSGLAMMGLALLSTLRARRRRQ